MVRTRRSLLAVMATMSPVALAGCSLQSEHGDEIRLENSRSSSVAIEITASPVSSDELVLDRSVTLAADEVTHVPDPTRTGQTTVPHVITVETEGSLSARREWEPANVGTQLKVIVRGEDIQWDVGAPE
jgi:hypothetical protein